MKTNSFPPHVKAQQIAAEAFWESVSPKIVLHQMGAAAAVSTDEPVDFECMVFNAAAAAFFFRSAGKSLEGKRLSELYDPATFRSLSAHFHHTLETGEPQSFERPVASNSEDDQLWYEIVSVPVDKGVAVTFYNVTEKRISEERLRRNYNQLVDTRKNLRTLNSTLEETVAQRTQALGESEERLRLVAQGHQRCHLRLGFCARQ